MNRQMLGLVKKKKVRTLLITESKAQTAIVAPELWVLTASTMTRKRTAATADAQLAKIARICAQTCEIRFAPTRAFVGESLFALYLDLLLYSIAGSSVHETPITWVTPSRFRGSFKFFLHGHRTQDSTTGIEALRNASRERLLHQE
jgi:hypothetical protein